MVLIALGLMMPFNSIQNFLVDAFVPYSAAAIACATGVGSFLEHMLILDAVDFRLCITRIQWGHVCRPGMGMGRHSFGSDSFIGSSCPGHRKIVFALCTDGRCSDTVKD